MLVEGDKKAAAGVLGLREKQKQSVAGGRLSCGGWVPGRGTPDLAPKWTQELSSGALWGDVLSMSALYV